MSGSSWLDRRPSHRAAYGSFIVLGLFVAAGSAAAGRMPLLMPDDFDQLHGVTWRVEPGTPDQNNPLLEGEMPWDAGGVMSHGTVMRDPIDGQWKAWLVCTPPEETTKVASKNHYHRRVCYFESDDGVNWTRPKLPNSSFGDYKRTNIVFGGPEVGGAQYASVIVNPKDRDWPYEMFVYPRMYTGGGLHRYRSRDAKNWELVHGPIRGPFTSDVCFVYRGEDGSYVSYFRLTGEDKGSHVPPYECARGRTIYRTVSRDGRNWNDTEIIIRRDDRDHRDTQYMECVPHRVKGGYLGMISVYHPITQTLDLRLAASRDGRQWWFPDRRPCLANPPLGDYGGGMIWQCKELIVEDNTLYVYYCGSEGIHRSIWDTRAEKLDEVGLEKIIAKGSGFYPFNGVLCRASWRFDRMYALVSAAGGPTVGVAVTKPQDMAGKTLWVNLRTRPPKKSSKLGLDEGYLQIELLDSQGKPLPGFARDDCPLLRGDHQALAVKWAGGQRAPEGADKARFYLKRVFLYGFELRSPM